MGVMTTGKQRKSPLSDFGHMCERLEDDLVMTRKRVPNSNSHYA